MARCIFCPNKADSGEHIWAEWLKAYVPHTQINHYEGLTVVHDDGTEDTFAKHRSGDPRSRKVKVVCTPCNTRWMSGIQEAVKPHLIPLVKGESCTLSMSGQAILSGWIALLVTVSEYTIKPLVTVQEADRAWIKANKTAPPNWHVWIGRFEPPDGHSRYQRYALPVVTEEELAQAAVEPGPLRYNAHATTFLVGQLFVHVIGGPKRLRFSFPKSIGADLRDISRVSGAITWPPTSLSENAYWAVAGEVRRRADRMLAKRK